MGSLGGAAASERDKKEMVISQVSFGGFDGSVTAKDLTHFLEHEVGLICRCRLKTSWTPPESYPDYSIPTSSPSITIADEFEKVPPHAFVHFVTPDAARRAINAAGRSELILGGHVLRVSSETASSARINRRRTMDPFRFPGVGVKAGFLVSRDQFLAAWRTPDSGVDFIIDPFDGFCRIAFTKDTVFPFKNIKKVAVIKCNFKVEFLIRDIAEVKVFMENAPFVLFLQLTTNPWLYYRTADDDVDDPMPYNLLDDDDPWIRTVDFTPSGAMGRCNTYRIEIPIRYGSKLKKALQYMKERRIPEHWPKGKIDFRDEPEFGLAVPDPFFCIHYKEGISFSTLFMVNAVVHKGIINQHQLSNEFFELLRVQNDAVNDTALRHIWAYKRPIFDACRRLKLVQEWLLKNIKLLRCPSSRDDYAEVRRLVISPTKAYCLPPEVELSNRVLRKYKKVEDRFMRVTFMDEGMEQLNNNVLNYYVASIVKDITSTTIQQKTTIFKRVKSILNDGFQLCGRRYYFLAFSSNQLRDRSAWFFADGKDITADGIRKWMGKFPQKNVALFAARMGQCFSSTYATVDVPKKEVNFDFPDIKINRYVFSDGIGKITPDLAAQVAEKLQLIESPPSAYQIRYAGCKGVIAIWPGNDDGIRLSLRGSMNKFESSHTMLEIVSWTRFQPGFLNRQIVTLLSALRVPDNIFARMQDTMICKLDQMMVDVDVAFEVVTASCPEQGSTAAIMLSAGFKPQMEPHLKAMLSCIRAAQLGDLLAKARIFVPKGRWLMGCFDELGALEQGQCFIQVSTPALENYFFKHGSRFSRANNNKQVIIGTVVIAKNPCLHPGDVRILEAVNVAGLHHLVDCLVFPQKGERPHANEASGSDLDGDLYFVTWEEDLIPPGKRSWPPMEYASAEVKKFGRQINHQDIIDFYLKNIVNENLGVICNAHVVHADISEYGALDENCLKLAELAATAVDFPKTGKSATMPQHLRPKVYPDFMGKNDYQSYKSEKILGRLYRKVKDATDEDVVNELSCTPETLPYDMELQIDGASEYLAEAWHTKCSYDGQLNALLGQYKVHSEGEIVTGHIWSLPKYNSRKQGELKERLKNAYSSLHKEFRHVFDAMGPDFSQLSDDKKGALYEMKASAWYQVTYNPYWVKKSNEMRQPDGDVVPARLSFAWIAADYLVRIKLRGCRRTKLSNTKPVDSLANYLYERI